jgi:hypothetical protein
MKRTIITAALTAILVLTVSGFAAAQADKSDAASNDLTEIGLPCVSVEFKNFFLIQNDRDFDRTEALYDENGQSVGYFSTTLTPKMMWMPIPQVTVVYEVQFGENLWSRNDAAQRDPSAPNVPIVQHKQMWGQVESGAMYVKAGYWLKSDPTSLFFHREIGAATLGFKPGGAVHWVEAFVGQVPDGVHEGTTAVPTGSEFEQNNFENDTFVYGLGAPVEAGKLLLIPAVLGLTDKSVIDRELNLVVPTIAIREHYTPMNLALELVGEFGTHQGAGIDNRDVDRFAFAAQIHEDLRTTHWAWATNLLWLSADDGDKNDLLDTSFAYSGFSKSATLLLSENELQDQYDNLDERIAAQGAGMFLADTRVAFVPFEALQLFGIAGYGSVLESKNLDDDPMVGLELDGGLQVDFYRGVAQFTVVGGALLPGASGAVVKNEIDLTATDPIYHGQALMRLSF